ncbi:hypothetical protein BGX24_007125 [Mortierella sp. AD032]|nr:hypothetical protein BGX24_007125 [Mortierella sp. AD032]
MLAKNAFQSPAKVSRSSKAPVIEPSCAAECLAAATVPISADGPKATAVNTMMNVTKFITIASILNVSTRLQKANKGTESALEQDRGVLNRTHMVEQDKIYFTATEEDQRAYLRNYPKRRRDDALFSKTVNTGEEDQMEGVLRRTPESLQQALELQHQDFQTKIEANQKQVQEWQQQALELQRHEFRRQMEANQQQMQALIDRVILLTSSIPALASSFL